MKKNKPNRYFIEGEPGSFGCRVFLCKNEFNKLPEQTYRTVVNNLNTASAWGGWDKNKKNWIGWELPNKEIAQLLLDTLKRTLENNNFKEVNNPFKRRK